MVWKYPKVQQQRGEQQLEESNIAANLASVKNWVFYEPKSAEYKEGLRARLELGTDDITHIEFEKSKGDYFLTVVPDNSKKNEVISIHRLSRAATQTNFIKGSGVFKKVGFFPGKPQIVILTATKLIIFNLEELVTYKKMSSGDNTYSTMAVHPNEPYVMVGGDNSKVTLGSLSCTASIWTLEPSPTRL